MPVSLLWLNSKLMDHLLASYLINVTESRFSNTFKINSLFADFMSMARQINSVFEMIFLPSSGLCHYILCLLLCLVIGVCLDLDHDLYQVFLFFPEVWSRRLVHNPAAFCGRLFATRTSTATQLVADSTAANTLDNGSPVIGIEIAICLSLI